MKLVAVPIRWPDNRTDWPTDRPLKVALALSRFTKRVIFTCDQIFICNKWCLCGYIAIVSMSCCVIGVFAKLILVVNWWACLSL
jgi:hypothetical protein